MSLEKRNGTRAGTVIGVHVELDFRTDYLPPRQILTGFLMLAEQSAIDLDLRCRKTLSDSHPERALVRATVDGHEIAYDVADDYYFDQEKTEELLSSLDAYFKRSYDPLTHDGWEGAERIHRLGCGTRRSTRWIGLNRKGTRAWWLDASLVMKCVHWSTLTR